LIKSVKNDEKSGRITSDEAADTEGTVTGDTYKTWMKAGSSIIAVFAIILLMLNEGTAQYSQMLVSHWASDKYGWTKQETNISTFVVDVEKCAADARLRNLRPILCANDPNMRMADLKMLMISGFN